MAFPAKKSSTAAVEVAVEEILDPPLYQFGFEFECYSPTKVSGHLLVTPRCCQPFGKLHGGVSALIGESLGSLGAILASGGKKAMGIQLSINHFKSAQLGDTVYAEATPITAGNTVQVWEVKLWKTTPSISTDRVLISSSRVTIVCHLQMSDSEKNVIKPFKKYAKL